MCKAIYFNHKPITDIHTYKRNLRLRPHQRLPGLHNYEPHAKAFKPYSALLVTL